MRRTSTVLLFSLFLALVLCLLPACGDSHDAVAQAGCDCQVGQDGTTAWCAVCAKGWIGGKQATGDPVTAKAAVDAQLAKEVRGNAEARGDSAAWIDLVVEDVASGKVVRKQCSCESCATGETDHAPADAGATVDPARRDAAADDAAADDAAKRDALPPTRTDRP